MAEQTLAEILKESEQRCRNMEAPLADRLQAFADDVRKIDAEFAAVVDRMVERLKASGAGEAAPKPGEQMPDFLLPDQNGRLVSLAELLEKGPVTIAFHRGHWCPYCRINASALATVHGDIKALGGELVAITPNREQFNQELKSDAKALFPILSDMDNGYALSVNVAIWVGEEKKQYMQRAGWDVTPFQGNDFWTLPIPATFIIGQDGRIKARFIDPDYRKRMAVADILAAVKACAA
jgi:peroxiredoxin